jgi:V/A-type H+/Na+-transporting ATPase subunit C
MRALAKYAFTNARVRAMLSLLLDGSQLQALSSANDIDNFFSALKATPYESILGSLTPPYDFKAVEQKLFCESVAKYKKILQSLKGKPFKVIFLLLSKHEIANLKNLLRVWHTKTDEEERAYLYDKKICYDIPVSDILSARNIEEIILLLDKTPYKNALMGARAKFKEKEALFYLEIALDIGYYKRLWEAVGALRSADRHVASKLVGIEVDIQNINWILRFKQYYNMPLGELISYIIPGGHTIGQSLIREVYSFGDIKSVVSGLSKKPYQDMAALVSGGYDTSKMLMLEVMLWQVLLKEAKRALAGFPFTIATIMAYLMLYTSESKNIVSLLYGKLYEWDSARIKGSLIC